MNSAAWEHGSCMASGCCFGDVTVRFLHGFGGGELADFGGRSASRFRGGCVTRARGGADRTTEYHSVEIFGFSGSQAHPEQAPFYSAPSFRDPRYSFFFFVIRKKSAIKFTTRAAHCTRVRSQPRVRGYRYDKCTFTPRCAVVVSCAGNRADLRRSACAWGPDAGQNRSNARRRKAAAQPVALDQDGRRLATLAVERTAALSPLRAGRAG